jgi:hypothetical protein
LLEGFELVHGDGERESFSAGDWTTGLAGATGSLGKWGGDMGL